MYGGDSCSMGFKIWELYLKIVAFKRSGTRHHKEVEL